MRLTPLFAGVLIIPVAFCLLSCGSGEKLSTVGSAEQAQQGAEDNAARPDGRVTLKPPYEGWIWSSNVEEPGISVENAVWAVTKQAGMDFDKIKSFENTKPLCRKYFEPVIEDEPWREAIDQILAPFNLTYVLEENSVVMMKVEEAQRREHVLREFRTAMAKLESANVDQHRLPDPVIVFPLLDEKGKTSQLGNLLSELGMMKATYTPQKIFNLHVPSIISVYEEMGYRSQVSISPEDIQRIRSRFNAKSFATGKIQMQEDGAYRVTLNFEGENGRSEFTTNGGKNDLYQVPQWIARCVHEYSRVTLTPEQTRYVGVPELRDTASVHSLMRLEYYRDPDKLRLFMGGNPDSALALYRYYLAIENDTEKSEPYLARAVSRFGNHGLIQFLEADTCHRAKDYQDSIPRFMELLETDFRNDTLYTQLIEELFACRLFDSIEELFNFWTAHNSDSYLPHLKQGRFYIDYAWDARGTGWASSVPIETFKKFKRRLQKAEPCLIRACELNPRDPRAPTNLIWVAIGLSQKRQQMEEWFKKATDADPKYYTAYYAKLTYLSPNWFDFPDEMFAFARQCAAAPEGSSVAFILVAAHDQMAEAADKNEYERIRYYQNPAVWNEIKAVYKNYLKEHFDSTYARNYLAKYACYAHDYEEAVYEFENIRGRFEKQCWGSKENFDKYKTEAYAKVKRANAR